MNAPVLPSQMRPGESRIPWTAEDIALLSQLVDEGKSRGQIAMVFAKTYPGASRAAICGKAHRLKAKSKNPPYVHPVGEPRKTITRAKRPQSSGGVLVAASSAEPPCRLRPVAPPEAIPQAGITIIDLCEGLCHFPLWQDGDDPRFYCGVRIEPDETYCPAHTRLMYVGLHKTRKLANV